MCDDTEQADEILALQSIYEENVFTCDNSKQTYNGKMEILVQDELGPYEFFCHDEIIQLKYLSPITLNFSLPSDYPSLNPPKITLSCVWLTPEQIEILSRKLFDLWNESRTVVLFMWINFLQVESISFLGIKFPIDLSQESILTLTRYCLQREEEDFEKEVHECPVCFCQKAGSSCVKLGDCGHIFCKECLTGFLSFHITEGSIIAIKCPAEECSTNVYPSVINSLVPQDVFERYDKLVLKKALEGMSDVEYCPRPKCGQPVVLRDDESFAVCQVCKFVFCIQCKSTYHGVDACKPPDDEDISDVHKNASKNGKEALEPHDKKRNATYGIKKNANWINQNTKKCPGCQIPIEKFLGCNKMHCQYCGTNFCWLCLSNLGATNPYEHFSNKKSPCNSKLFEIVPKKTRRK